MIPRELGPLPDAVGAEVGEMLRTSASERRSVILPDGSVLYVQGNSTVQVESERRVRVDRGEVNVEVERDEDHPFRVITPTRNAPGSAPTSSAYARAGGATA